MEDEVALNFWAFGVPLTQIQISCLILEIIQRIFQLNHPASTCGGHGAVATGHPKEIGDVRRIEMVKTSVTETIGGPSLFWHHVLENDA